MNDETFRVPPESFAWPERGDRLFTSAEDWWHNACLDPEVKSWEPYVIGYKKAGDILVEYIKSTQAEQDFLVFPAVFVYRQYLELRLKTLVKDGNLLFERPPVKEGSHYLNQLWKSVRAIIEELEPKASTEVLEAAGEVIRQFDGLDPIAQSFRYPVTQRGAPSLPPGLQLINLRQLSEVMARLSRFLDGASWELSLRLDYKREMEQEWGGDSQDPC